MVKESGLRRWLWPGEQMITRKMNSMRRKNFERNNYHDHYRPDLDSLLLCGSENLETDYPPNKKDK